MRVLPGTELPILISTETKPHNVHDTINIENTIMLISLVKESEIGKAQCHKQCP